MKVLVFTQPNCMPCKQLLPVLTDVCAKLAISLEIRDVTLDMQVVDVYNILSTPMVVVVDDDDYAVKYVSARNAISLLKELKPYVV